MTMVAGRSYELLIFCRVGLCHFTDLCTLVYNLGKMLNCPSSSSVAIWGAAVAIDHDLSRPTLMAAPT